MFLPATLNAGVLGADWGQGPLPGGWPGLLLAILATASPLMLGAGVLAYRARDRRTRET